MQTTIVAATVQFLLSVSHGIDYPLGEFLLPNSCNHLADGYRWIRPIQGTSDKGVEYPNIYVYCHDGYAILDVSLVDADNVQNPRSYFSTYADQTEVVASSSINEHVTWREWFLPDSHYYGNGDDTKQMSYRISEDCQTCETTDDYGESSVYYMTGNYIGCLWITKGYCDMDPDSLECYTCTASNSDEELSGLCTHMVADAGRAVNFDHDDCVGTSYNAEPSIGTNGQFCVCFKLDTADAKIVEAASWTEPEESFSISTQTSDTIVELYASDFETGTYRILEPGYYLIMEDIEFDMNAGDYDNPNEDGAWWPHESQSSMYDGVDATFVGPYSMGFFAGLAIEAEGVTIDLNGHTLAMSKVFHLQQRWFSIIEIGSKAFISGQGPGMFGAFMTAAKDVTIRDGIVGLSSHHGIHGNNPENVVIKNVVIKDFEVGGIAINGFTNLQINNVEIGPIYTSVPVLGVYTQARIMLSRLRAIYDANPEGTVTFGNKKGKYSADDIRDELALQMDIVFDHYINGVDWEDFDDQAEVQRTRELFENENEIPSASTVYGMFLNSNGASVFSVGGAPGTSTGLDMKNVKIHGLYNDPWEVPRMVLTKGPFNDIMDLTRVTSNGLTVLSEAEYIGSAYTDAQYALHRLTESWTILGHSVMKNSIQNWIGKGKTLNSGKIRCNNDIMLHVTKGVWGIRLDNVDGFDMSNIEISDIQNVGQLGSYVCGNYESEDDGGHRNQNYPLQHGYTGTEIHAIAFVGSTGKISNIDISKVISARGDVMAIQFFPGNEIEVGENIKISDIHAGAYLWEDELPEDNYPNKVPRACAIDYWDWTDEENGWNPNYIDFDVDHVKAKCLSGHTVCSDSEFDGDLMEEFYHECDDTSLISANVKKGDAFEKISQNFAPSAKLMKVLKSHPPRHRYSRHTNHSSWIMYIVVATFIVSLGYFIYSKQKNNKSKLFNKENVVQSIETVSDKVGSIFDDSTNNEEYKEMKDEKPESEPLIG